MGSAQVVTGLVGSSSSTIMGLAPLATKCFLLVVCVTLAEGSQRVRRWNACNACNGGGGSSWGGGGGSNSGGGGCGGGCWKKKRSAVEQMIARYQQTDD